MKICTKCGYTTEREAKFCFQCGGPMEELAEAAARVEAEQLAQKMTETGVEAVTKTTTSASRVEKAKAGQKKNNLWIIAVVAIVIVALIAGGVMIFLGGDKEAEDNLDQDEIETNLDEEDGDADLDEEEVLPELDEEGNSELTEFEAPIFDTVYGSSTLESDGVNSYGAENLVDGKSTTAWVEGVAGYGEGEYVVFGANEIQKVSKISIRNGYCKTSAIYSKNSAPARLEISFSEGTTYEIDLNNVYNDIFTLELSEPVLCNKVVIKVLSVYQGTECDDTCISDIWFE